MNPSGKIGSGPSLSDGCSSIFQGSFLPKSRCPRKRQKNVIALNKVGRVIVNPVFEELKQKYESLKRKVPTLDGFPVVSFSKRPKREDCENVSPNNATTNDGLFNSFTSKRFPPGSVNCKEPIQLNPVHGNCFKRAVQKADFFSDIVPNSFFGSNPSLGFVAEEITIKHQFLKYLGNGAQPKTFEHSDDIPVQNHYLVTDFFEQNVLCNQESYDGFMSDHTNYTG